MTKTRQHEESPSAAASKKNRTPFLDSLRSGPLAALAVLALTLIIAIVGISRIVPHADVTVKFHGAVGLAQAQVRAALDGGPAGRTRAYAPLTVNVCSEKRSQKCLGMGQGEVGVNLRDTDTPTDISTSKFPVQTHDTDSRHVTGPRHPDAATMVRHAVHSAQGAGQRAGQVSAAANAAIEAQSLNVSRSPAW